MAPSDVFGELIRFETELWNAVDARLRTEHDLPLSRFEPMQVIDRREGCRVQDIAEELAITVGGASKLVDRIEASGLCRRRPNPDDRRSSVIELTPAGQRTLAEVTATFDAELQRRLGAVASKRDLDRLHATVTELRRAGHDIDRSRPGT